MSITDRDESRIVGAGVELLAFRLWRLEEEPEWGVGEGADDGSFAASSPAPPSRPQECEVVLKAGFLSLTAHVQGMRSKVRQGVAGNDAIIEDGKIKMVTGHFKQIIGDFSDGKTWYVEAPLRSEVSPVRGGSTTVSRGAIKNTVTSSGCSNGQVYLGAIHLVAYQNQHRPARMSP